MKCYTPAAIALLLLLSLSTLAGGTEPPAAEPEADKTNTVEAKTTAKDILNAYHRALYEKLSPKLSDHRSEDIQIMAAQLAREHLIPNKELLHRQAGQMLEKLPQLNAGRLDHMRSVLDGDNQKQLETAIGIFGSVPRADNESTKELVGMLMAASQWNPAHAAKTVRSGSMVRVLGMADYGKRALLESLAPPKITALDKDPEKPAIAFIAGPEIFVVWLEYSKDDGYYKPTKAKWLTEVAKEQ